MARKTHKKSKTGCSECKRRHLKCDETHPICLKCMSSERQCMYEPPKRRAISGGVSSRDASNSVDVTFGDSANLSNYHTAAASGEIFVNIDHLELFYHFQTESCKTIARTETQIEILRRAIITRSFSNPFLMHQILGLSAMHMSLIRPQRAPFYQNMAASFHSQALQGFNEFLPRVDASTCVEVLLFSHMIALYVFCDIFNTFDSNFNVFLERLVGFIKLFRGVNVVMQTWGTHLYATEMGQIITESSHHQDKPKISYGECLPLKELINAANLNESSIDTCHKALSKLQIYFDAENAFEEESASTNMLFAWIVTASVEYTELLEQRRPEALVLLAYYAVLLHKRRKSWAIGGAGKRLFNAINEYLGGHWERWLSWPNSVINEGSASAIPTPGSTNYTESYMSPAV